MRNQKFVEYLQTLANKDDRMALATLRRGIGTASKYRIGMYRYIANWVASDEGRWSEECLYLVASLFALYPDAPTASGNLGDSVRLLCEDSVSESVERRFVALLSADTLGLPTHLRYMVSLLKAKRIGVNWPSLLHDIQRWKYPARHVERAWARRFWHSPNSLDQPQPSTSPNS